MPEPLQVSDEIKAAIGKPGQVVVHEVTAAFARKNNLPGVIVHGALKGMIVGRLLEEWIGPAGRIVRWQTAYRGMDRARQDLTVWARVTRKYQEGAEGRLDLEVGVRGADGQEGRPGTATVALPLRTAGAQGGGR